MPVNTIIKMRRGTASQWASANPVLGAGEMGFESDTRKFKFGNGITNWAAMPYASAGGVEAGGFFVSETAPVGANVGDIWYNISDTGTEAGKSFIWYEGYWVELNPGTLGPQGSTGATGPANTLTVGTVTTLAAGELATVEITGTAPNQTVNFGIPTGADGATGATGIVTSATEPANTEVLWVDTNTDATVESTLTGGTAGYTALSAGTAGLTYQPVSHNYIINGAFDVWQRGTAVTFTGNANDYLADRLALTQAWNTSTYSQQTFTPGAAPVSGYEGEYFARVAVTTASNALSYSQIDQRVEDVRILAGQTVTFSYWAKADSAKSVTVELQQRFGSGGSASVNTFIAKPTLTTSWARYTHTFTVPSVSGKTIESGSLASFRIWLSAGSTYDTRTDTLGEQNITFDIWGVQLEAGSVATPFKRNAPSLQGELAACQRYYYKLTDDTINPIMMGSAQSNTKIAGVVNFPVQMRSKPTFEIDTGGNYYSFYTNDSGDVFTTLNLDIANKTMAVLNATSGISTTTGFAGYVRTVNTAAYIAFSSEL